MVKVSDAACCKGLKAMVVMVDMTIQELMMKGMNHIKEKAPDPKSSCENLLALHKFDRFTLLLLV